MWAVGAASGRDSGGSGSRGYPASRRGTEEGSVGQTAGGRERRFRGPRGGRRVPATAESPRKPFLSPVRPEWGEEEAGGRGAFTDRGGALNLRRAGRSACGMVM